jgi:O-acetylhomoserine/O-acetylserine sulfhydrylase-like pyridoxal-dependent enzyme
MHYRMGTIELAASGVLSGAVLVSVGLDDLAELVADERHALI